MAHVTHPENILALVDYLYGPTKPVHEPKYQRRQELIKQAEGPFGEWGSRIHSDLKQLLTGYDVRNRTDWNYDSCFSFDVLLHPGIRYMVRDHNDAVALVQRLGGMQYTLKLHISALGPYYICQFCRLDLVEHTREFAWHSSRGGFLPAHESVRHRLLSYLADNGFSELSSDVLNYVIPWLALENVEENVTVYNVLFSDQERQW